jgi:hypothetical protein
MSGWLQTKVGDIHEADLLLLIDELEQACQVGSREFVDLPLAIFLTQCVYPEGPAKRVSITTKHMPSAPLLGARIGKLPEGALRDLCGELAVLGGEALEFFHSRKVYALLNKALPKHATVKAPGTRQTRWDAVVHRRRSNR